MILDMELTPAQRRKAQRMIDDEQSVLREVVCRFWPSGVWELKWNAWLDWWQDHQNGWLAPRRAFGVWLRQQVDPDATTGGGR
jgi:hypothetical protein